MPKKKNAYYLIFLFIIIIILVLFLLLASSNKKNDLNDSKNIDKIKQTNQIVIQVDNKQEKIIKDKQSINTIIRIILDSKKENGFVNLDGTTKKIILYDSNNNTIFRIKVWNNGYFGFNAKEYKIQSKDLDTFIRIIEE